MKFLLIGPASFWTLFGNNWNLVSTHEGSLPTESGHSFTNGVHRHCQETHVSTRTFTGDM
jgi:hypothetical protein